MWVQIPPSPLLESGQWRTEMENRNRILHINYQGQSIDVDYTTLDLGDMSSDQEIREATARYLNEPVAKFVNFTIDRHETGTMSIRPPATFG